MLPSPVILDIQHLSVQFPTDAGLVTAVQDLSLSIRRGETVGVVGESGSGKSVTALAVMGLLPPRSQVSGQVLLSEGTHSDSSGIDLLALSLQAQRVYRGNRLAMIFQEPLTSLNPVYTCGDQVMEALRLHQGCDRQDAKERAIALFEEVKLPSPDLILNRYPHELSGGQQQRVMIAIALSGNPDILIADEPTTALDVTVQATILELLQNIQATRGMAMLFITHDMGVVAEISDRVAVMYQGQLVETANVYDLFATPQHPYTQGLLNCRPRPEVRLKRLPTVADYMGANLEPATQPQKTTSSESSPDAPETPSLFISAADTAERQTQLQQQKPLLQVENLNKDFVIQRSLFRSSRTLRVVDSVSFEVYPGETLGLVGESGCGKSTLSRCLLRLIEPTSGRITFDGASILDLSPEALRSLRRSMQIVFQNPYGSLNARQRIGTAIMEPMVIHQIGASDAERRDRAIALLEKVGLDATAFNRLPHEFSGGQRQRICIARALACEPKFLICDESVSALDVSVQAQVLNLLKDLQADFGLTYIFISHDLGVVKFVSDRIMVMHRGQIVETGAADSIYTNPQQDYTRCLINAIPKIQLSHIQERQAARAAIASHSE